MATNDVNSVQSSSQDLMKAQYDVVKGFIETLRGFVLQDSVTIPDPDVVRNFLDPTFARDAFQRLDILRPTWKIKDGTDPFPAAPSTQLSLRDIDPVVVENLPDLSATPYSPVIPASPSTALPTAPTPVALQTPAIPSVPTFSLPAAPTFQAVAMPSPLGLNIPDFQFSVPISDLTAPTASFTFNEQDYHSVLSDAVKMKLLTDIENGGYGIEVSDERALWDRARERTATEANAKVEQALSAAAARGFSLPPGADYALIAEAQQAALEKIASVDREIALKRADMYVENRKFSLSTANQVESMFINYRSAMMERSLNAAKAVVELSISIFTARKDKFLSDLEAYKAYASVFETKIRAETVKIELFKGQIEGAKGQIAVQQGMADIYRTQLEGVKTLIDVYRTQMEGTKVLMEVERSKLESFRMQMEGYATQVQAKNAEFGLYEAQIRGEVAKMQSYESQVRAFASRVEAFKAKVGAQESRVNAQKAYNEAKIQAYDGQLKTYQIQLDKTLKQLATNTELYKADLALYGQTSDNMGRQLDLGFKVNATNLGLESKYVDRDVARIEREINSLFKLMDWRLNAAKYGTDATTNLAVAAAQQITGLTSLLK